MTPLQAMITGWLYYRADRSLSGPIYRGNRKSVITDTAVYTNRVTLQTLQDRGWIVEVEDGTSKPIFKLTLAGISAVEKNAPAGGLRSN